MLDFGGVLGGVRGLIPALIVHQCSDVLNGCLNDWFRDDGLWLLTSVSVPTSDRFSFSAMTRHVKEGLRPCGDPIHVP